MSEKQVKNNEERKDLDLLNRLKGLPGGLVIVPLVIAVVPV